MAQEQRVMLHKWTKKSLFYVFLHSTASGWQYTIYNAIPGVRMNVSAQKNYERQ